MFLLNEEVHYLAETWLQMKMLESDLMPVGESELHSFLTSTGTFDQILLDIVRDMQQFAAHSTFSAPRNPRHPNLRLRVSNTCDAAGQGEHWFTIGYSIQHPCPESI